MSLPIAQRGDKDYLRHLWEAAEFDFALACRMHGRNDAVWVFCYRRHLTGEPLPDEAEIKKLVREANRATGGLNQLGEKERYKRYEAEQTVGQVSSYSSLSHGLRPLIKARRRWIDKSRSKYARDPARRLLSAICNLAETCGRIHELRASHRQLAAAAGLHPTEVSGLLYSLQAAGQVFRLGFTPCHNGQPRGTTRLSLKPPRPDQRIDEQEPPKWDAIQACWTWRTPLARGRITKARWRWLSKTAADVPYVYGSSPREEISPSPSAFRDLDNPLRGSP